MGFTAREGSLPSSGTRFPLGRHCALWEEPYFDGGLGVRQYHVAPDGRFLMIRQGAATDEATAAPEIILVQNWFEELKRLVPVP